ncbi:hypothetical protein BLOT_006293 [Blomia tropicalis]|nr:hypothetical protein BLOT_006293 [Blomia tropicalis]
MLVECVIKQQQLKLILIVHLDDVLTTNFHSGHIIATTTQLQLSFNCTLRPVYLSLIESLLSVTVSFSRSFNEFNLLDTIDQVGVTLSFGHVSCRISVHVHGRAQLVNTCSLRNSVLSI